MKEQIIGQVAMVVTALLMKWFSPIGKRSDERRRLNEVDLAPRAGVKFGATSGQDES